jgi:hypothetical protein
MKVGVFNLGTDEYCEVNDSIGWICEHLGLSPKREYAGGSRGWIGDSPFIFLDCSKIRTLGWRPKLTIREGVIRTVQYLEQNPWILERRACRSLPESWICEARIERAVTGEAPLSSTAAGSVPDPNLQGALAGAPRPIR